GSGAQRKRSGAWARTAADPGSRPGARASAERLDDAVTILRGIGPRQAEHLAVLGIRTVRDLLYHAPSRYRDFSRLSRINQLRPGEDATVVGTVWDVKKRRIPAGNRHMLTVVVSDTTANVQCTFFNQPYLEREFSIGDQLVVSGKVDVWAGRLVFRAPEWERLERDLVHTGRLVPIYPLTQGVTQRWLRRQIKQTVDEWAPHVEDPLPRDLRQRAGVVALPAALRDLHFPEHAAALDAARARLAFDELLVLQLWLMRRRRTARARPGIDLSNGRPALDAFVAALPFTLTGAQVRVIDEIAADLSRSEPMSRLLQGDVGCGKTAVAGAAMAMCVGAGHQAALMAPTEILAEQHFANLCRLLAADGFTAYDPASPDTGGHRLARLVGGMKAGDKAAVAAALAAGKIDIVVGTHAVIQDAVRFERLGLAVVDEQHRFGVLQRAELQAGTSPASAAVPHMLIMTATPIPRTLAQVINADLDQSVIDEMPPGRQSVKTYWLGPQERERGYQYIRHRVGQSEQAYVVCPLVEESERLASPSAIAEYERLRTEVFPDLRLGLLHGRMRPAEKEAVMADFHAGRIQVLVSTTVIEVGVDVPNATVMLIDGADRFGLAQLHQLRGRVGRGTAESVCLLMAHDPSETAAARLRLMTETSDGLVLAEKDLATRGPGDYFGVQQSGIVDRFRFARLVPGDPLTRAQRVAGTLMADDPELARPDLAALRAEVEAFSAGAGRI
ncbi:MAG: ATP-dependent DNA helicase RecG, partial [Chloroflexi bacterium CFX6]|nr:ATP-dependent DNA helicase RecG [Chloroflexi bacterium CFX6]